MPPKAEEPVAETIDSAEPVEITEGEFPKWHALATEAMREVAVGDVERWS